MKTRLSMVFLLRLVCLAFLLLAASACSSDPGTSENGGDLNNDFNAEIGDCVEDHECEEAGVGQVGQCQSGQCVYVCEQGLASCDGDPATGCETSLTEVAHCGACDNRCESDASNYAPICGESGQCGVENGVCAEGFVNTNGDESDGCECEVVSEVDRPDDEGRDENCDGIDGTVEHAVFVSVSGGDDDADGLTPASPVASLSRGLEIAEAEQRHYLLLARGTYNETVTLQNGIGIYGGYALDFSVRDVAENVVVIDTAEVAAFDDALHLRGVVAENLVEETIVDGVTIRGPDAARDGAAGASSYAVWAMNSPGLQLRRTTVFAGPGADGSEGSDGADGSDYFCGAHGGSGGQNAYFTCGPANTTNTRGQDGSAGYAGNSSNSGGAGGVGRVNRCAVSDFCEPSGEDGGHGEDGVEGADGVHGQVENSPGLVVDGLWQSASSTAATDGDDGTGGGGGGAGGGCYSRWGTSGIGGMGGRGGDGGCGGLAGENGMSGGASFAIFLVESPVLLHQVELVLANAGAGGDGGDGGQGALADDTTRRDGAVVTTTGVGSGGNGGYGKDGGSGGGGAGGCGGHSVGIGWAGGEPLAEGLLFSLETQPAPGGAGGRHGAPSISELAPGDCAGFVEEVLEIGLH